ncbi:MAG: carbohydrate ABC transporter permease [Spirochaetia bacterium]|nr:carbohydrate ABC transporter permease [Spirochaetia bacterium]
MEKVKNPIGRVLIYLALILLVVYSVMPFVWSLLTSIKYPIEANNPKPKLFGFTPTMMNYEELWLYMEGSAFVPYAIAMLVLMIVIVVFAVLSVRLQWLSKPVTNMIAVGLFLVLLFVLPQVAQMSKFYDYFLNSLVVTVGTLVVSISIGCVGGYALARYSKIWGVIILIAALGFRALPRMAFSLPYYFIAQMTHLYDTRILLIIVMVAINQPFTIWMLRSFFMDIPKEIEEAAMIDGAGRLESFFKVIIPIAWPGIITTSLFTLLLAYNEFLMPKILTQANWTLPVAIASYTSGEDAAYRAIAAAASVSITIPIIIVIIFFQKYLVKGLAFGAVKG